MKNKVVLVILTLAGITSYSQQNYKLNNIVFTYSDSTANISGDTSNVYPVNIRTYDISFSVADTVQSDTSGFAAVYIELKNLKTKQVFASQKYTLDELQIAGFIDNWIVSIPIGPFNDFPMGSTRASIVIESSNGRLGKIHKKTVAP